MLRRDAPLLMNPTPSWHKYSWMAEFCPPYSELPTEYASRRCVSRSRPAAICSRWPSARISTSILKRCGILHFYRDKASFDKALEGERASDRRRPRTAAGDARGDPSDRAHAEGVILWRLLHAVGFDGRHPQVHARPRRRLRPPWRAVSSTTPRSRASFPKDGGFEIRWLPVAPDDDAEAAVDVWRPIQVDGIVICAGDREPPVRGHARRPAQHLSGQGLLDHGPPPHAGKPRPPPRR